MIEKPCKSCGQNLPLEAFGKNYKGHLGYHSRCYRCMKDVWYREQYGVGCDYMENELRRQKSRCATCRRKFRGDPFRPPFHTGMRQVLDHDRMTGHPRGVVCVRCASMLGMIEDDVELVKSIQSYILRWA